LRENSQVSPPCVFSIAFAIKEELALNNRLSPQALLGTFLDKPNETRAGQIRARKICIENLLGGRWLGLQTLAAGAVDGMFMKTKGSTLG
jgi:hypothetical protein